MQNTQIVPPSAGDIAWANEEVTKLQSAARRTKAEKLRKQKFENQTIMYINALFLIIILGATVLNVLLN
jgi:hypothetical protein